MRGCTHTHIHTLQSKTKPEGKSGILRRDKNKDTRTFPASPFAAFLSLDDREAGDGSTSGQVTELIIHSSLSCISFHVGPSVASLC